MRGERNLRNLLQKRPPPPSDGLWGGKAAFLIGGGPSLKDFPWEVLRGAPAIIAVNRAYRECPWADYFFTEDERFVRRFAIEDPEGWRRFSGLKILHLLDEAFRPEVLQADPSLFTIARKRLDKYWSDRIEDGLSLSSNSMVGAINLAAILGANPIYLLGVDCKVSGGRTSNYHDSYTGDWVTLDEQYASFKSDFTHWVAPHLAKRGIEVVNLNPASAVECWLKRDWREVLPWK